LAKQGHAQRKDSCGAANIWAFLYVSWQCMGTV
jgi:hypothetical protein